MGVPHWGRRSGVDAEQAGPGTLTDAEQAGPGTLTDAKQAGPGTLTDAKQAGPGTLTDAERSGLQAVSEPVLTAALVRPAARTYPTRDQHEGRRALRLEVALALRSCRRGDRITVRFAALHMSAPGRFCCRSRLKEASSSDSVIARH
jgi:hypothetical protein